MATMGLYGNLIQPAASHVQESTTPSGFTRSQIPQVDVLQCMTFGEWIVTEAEIELDTSDSRKSESPDCYLIGGRHQIFWVDV